MPDQHSGNTEAVHTLKTSQNYIIVKDNEDYLITDEFRVCGLKTFLARIFEYSDSELTM